jgi:hypothetical protein
VTGADIEALEAILDRSTLALLLHALAGICAEKAAGIEETWQDHRLATQWRAAMARIDATAESKAVGVIS